MAPLDGFTDQPFRSICRGLGSSVTYTEFVNVLDVPKMLPYIQERIAFTEQERPIAFQLYGSNAEEIIPAALKMMAFKPDFFDLNLGCSERRVSGRGAGAGLLNKPREIEKIINGLIRETGLPVTAKIRLGYTKTDMNFLSISSLLEDCGASMIAVHGRTRDQRWREPAIWEPITLISQSVSVPIIGNGDIRSLQDIDQMMDQTHCAAVMIGRAAIGNPWIFSRINKSTLARKEILAMIKLHWAKVKVFYSSKSSLVSFNKHLKAYLSCPQFFGLDLKKLLAGPAPVEELLAFCDAEI